MEKDAKWTEDKAKKKGNKKQIGKKNEQTHFKRAKHDIVPISV